MNKWSDIKSNKWLAVILHILAWIIIMLIPRYLVNTYGSGNTPFLSHLYLNLAIYGVLFYTNYLYLVPKLFYRGYRGRYFLIATGLITIICVIMYYADDYLIFNREQFREMEKIMDEFGRQNYLQKPPPPIRQFKLLDYFYTSLLVFGFSLGLKLLEKITLDEKKHKELEKENLNSELALLKNQISPHFFFNTLNNIYSLIDINKENARDSVLKLSKMMRYLLYESDKGDSRLSEEIAFLGSFIDLMKLRVNEKVSLSVDLPAEYTDHKIPPLMFIPFIENAFKHGISYREPSFIRIKMEVTKNTIIFSTSNSVARNKSEYPELYSGIGLDNVKKRLNLLFPGSHSLLISETQNEFSVVLNLFINKNETD